MKKHYEKINRMETGKEFFDYCEKQMEKDKDFVMMDALACFISSLTKKVAIYKQIIKGYEERDEQNAKENTKN